MSYFLMVENTFGILISTSIYKIQKYFLKYDMKNSISTILQKVDTIIYTRAAQ